MGTEAQRAPVPPRPTNPPDCRVSTPPGPAAHASEPPAAEPAATKAPPVEPPAAEATARLRPVPPAPPHPSGTPAAPAFPPRPGTPPAATRRRPVGAVDLGAPPSWPGGPAAPPAYRPPHSHPPAETPAETTTRLRPVRTRHPFRTAAAAVCVVLGLGLIGGAATGSWLISDSSADPAAHSTYTVGRAAWHSVPVDTLFPRTLMGDGAGPGGSDRVWTRLAVAPDSGCTTALDPLLLKTLRPAGCARLLRATYADATSSSVTTVGLLFTEGDTDAMRALSTRFTDEHLDGRSDLMPRAYPVKNSPAAGFGDRQRASWTVHVLAEVPVVVFAVSGFADGRTVTAPQPAAKAMAPNATTAAAQAGLGHEAKGLADRVERGLRRTVTDLTQKPE
ncbi:hypothetical protein EES39_36215 [Streptomyces sp. ADI92-24]|nr:hypothetical protein EES39_36215 [Streptomyces sp. ADI92-24]